MSEKYKLSNKTYFLLLFIIAPIFSYLIQTEKFLFNIQPMELLFVIGVGYILINNDIIKKRRCLKMDLSFLILTIVYTLNFIFHDFAKVGVELIGGFYLILVYFLVSTISYDIRKDLYKVISLTGKIGFWILLLVGFIGFGLYWGLGISKFVLLYPKYPYFGDVFRIKGFSYSPNMYISLLAFFTILKTAFNKIGYFDIILVFFIAIISLTKEALILNAVLIAILFFKAKRFESLGIFGVIIAGILYVIFSFFVFSIDNNKSLASQKKSSVFQSQPILEINALKVYPTTYFSLFKSGLEISKKNALKGI